MTNSPLPYEHNWRAINFSRKTHPPCRPLNETDLPIFALCRQSPFVAGVEYKLDYIVELGAKTIWLSPIYKSPMKALGYDIEDFKEVDGSFGSLEDFKDLVQETRNRGKRQYCSYGMVWLVWFLEWRLIPYAELIGWRL